MLVDYNSLLLALGMAGGCLSIGLFGIWLTARTEGFLLAWAVGVLLVVLGIFAYGAYVASGNPRHAFAAMIPLLAGLGIVLGAARQFRAGRFPVVWTAIVIAGAELVTLPPFAFGYDGLGFIVENFVVAAMLAATAGYYWANRDEAPVPVIGLTSLYGVTATSFALCGLVLVVDGNLVLDRPPHGWAENVSLIVCIAGLTGIGALSLALNQFRLARSHRKDAMTDPLTGLLNRRALFELYGGGFPAATAVIVFDLDNFKVINDKYGHAIGDETLQCFAAVIRENVRGTDAAARIGGEEFAVVLPDATPELAGAVAERIRAIFAARPLRTDRGPLLCTVSAGVGFAAKGAVDLGTALSLADRALYRAKHDGRNRVVLPEFRLVG